MIVCFGYIHVDCGVDKSAKVSDKYFSLLSYTHNRRPVRLTAVIAVDLVSILVDLELFYDLVAIEVGNLAVHRPCWMRSSCARLSGGCHLCSCLRGLVACRLSLDLPPRVKRGIVLLRF